MEMDKSKVYTEIAINRRRFMMWTALTAGGVLVSKQLLRAASLVAEDTTASTHRYSVGVCDWMILKRQDIGAFKLSKRIGVNGVEVDMGGLGNRKAFDNQLSDPKVRQAFLETAANYGLKICSLSMSAFYAQSFPERKEAVDLVKGCIDTMQQMKVKIAFLPLGIQGDLVKYPELRTPVVKRLQTVAKYAEQAKVIVGIETALDASGEVDLLNDIGSTAIQSYFNFENPIRGNRDLCQELKILGKSRICQIHCTNEDGVWLQNDPAIDLLKVKATLDAMGWKGWLVMERSRDVSDVHNRVWNYGANARYLKKIFQN